VNHQLSYATRLAAIVLLVGIAVVACGRPNGAADNQSASSTPAAQQSQADPVETDSAAPGDAATDSAAQAASPAAAATADPLDTQLSNLDSLLNGVNGSLSGSDTSGGE
jgi:hypothetical protein